MKKALKKVAAFVAVAAVLLCSCEKTEKVMLYAEDGATIEVSENKTEEYLSEGWHETLAETQQELYAEDGRTLTVYKSEVDDYKSEGWHETLAETQQELYAEDGRTLTVYKSEVDDYKSVGWYETKEAAETAKKKATAASNASSDTGKKNTNSGNSNPDGHYYVTPTGKCYHLDPDCGGKNSYRTNNIAGYRACKKCAK